MPLRNNVLPPTGLLMHSGNGATRWISQMPISEVTFKAHLYNLSLITGVKCGLQTVWVIFLTVSKENVELFRISL